MLPGADDRHPVAELLDLGQQVAREHHRDPLVGQPPDQQAHVPHAARIEAGGRLVEQQQLRIAQQRGGDSEPLAHAVRVAPDPIAGPLGQLDRRQRGVDPLAAPSPSKAASSSRLRRPVR